jgi:sec-independent protein translocase protein TatB
MLPEIGATELLVIAAVALIVVGPKDLPLLMRRIGQFMAKMRAMAADFRSSFDEMARQSELDDLRREVDAMRQGRLMEEAAASAGQADLQSVFGEIDQGLRASPPPLIDIEQDEEVPGAAPPPPTPKARKSRAPKATSEVAPKATAKVAPKPTETASPKPRAKKAASPKPAAAKGAEKTAAKPSAKPVAKARAKKVGAEA